MSHEITSEEKLCIITAVQTKQIDAESIIDYFNQISPLDALWSINKDDKKETKRLHIVRG